jgi:putative membrane-bound dehydrogenase-like protein
MPPLPALPLVAAVLMAQSPTPPVAPAAPTTTPAGTTAAATTPPPAAPSIAPVAPLSWAVFAQDPLVQDPVSFCVADDGSLFIAESFRQEKGVEDNRSSKFWLEDDLQLQSVEDRLQMYEKWASKREGGMDYYRKEEDRVTHLVDTNGDGIPDKVTSFSGPMNDPLDGTGAGVAVIDGSVWYTCIPSLWRFQDTKGTGVADVREKMFTGFGIRTALRGHDMHGLVQGPDGRVYWSIGDRGYRIRSKEGKELSRTFTGAVFRCEPDGSHLEVFAHSLRNPQELAFNQWGDLFTGDNNSDGGDRARIVYIMEGGETGWDMNYQTLEGANQRGPWSQEHTWWKWDAADPVRPAWTLPPIEHLSDGPAGLAFYPGLGLPTRYQNHFFLCDFLGGDEYSQILSFAVEPQGAGYTVTDSHEFVKEVLPTDVDFGWDGKMYISDWSNGWYSDHTGQMFTVWDPTLIEDVNIRTAQNLVREGFGKQAESLLLQCLAHPDIRIRQRAHLELARRGAKTTDSLVTVAADAGQAFAPRFHALWALGVQARHGADAGQRMAKADAAVVARLADENAEIRRLSARLAGDARIATAGDALVSLLTDEDLRVRAQAAIALGKIKHTSAMQNIAAMAWENENQDPFLRHAAVMGLVGMEQPDKIHELAADPFPQTRLTAVLAMRMTRDPQLARLLHDPDLRVATEAARAINDLPILEAEPALAALAAKFAPDDRALATAADAAKDKSTWERQMWTDRKGFSAAQLASDPIWSTKADRSEFLDECSGFAKAGNDYVQRVRGTFKVPATGDYVFSVASDDDSVLLISAKGDPAAAKQVAKVENYVNPGDWEAQPGQFATVHLDAGDEAYIEARAFQGGGGNHLAVGVVHPDGKKEQPIGSFMGDNSSMPLLRRVINENVREGTPANAAAIAAMAANPALAPAARIEAMDALATFLAPAARDRVNGHWRPVDAGERSKDAYVAVLKQRIPSLATNGPSAVRTIARELAAKYGVPMDSGAALAAVLDRTKSVQERVACLMQLAQDRDVKLAQAVDAALISDEPRLRAQARTIVVRNDPKRGQEMLNAAISGGTTLEKQAAIAAIGASEGAAADAALADLVASMTAGALPPALAIDVIDAVATRPKLKDQAAVWSSNLTANDKLGTWLLTLEGGDVERGRQVVNFNSAAACLRCHMVEGTGGHAAPSLAGVANRYDRRGMLLSIVEPNAQVAQGFGPISAMPAMGTVLTPREVRDVVEYLGTLK